MAICQPLERRRRLVTDRADAPRTAAAEGAAYRLLRGARQRTFEDDARAARVWIRNGDGGEERLGVRMKGRRELTPRWCRGTSRLSGLMGSPPPRGRGR